MASVFLQSINNKYFAFSTKRKMVRNKVFHALYSMYIKFSKAIKGIKWSSGCFQ